MEATKETLALNDDEMQDPLLPPSCLKAPSISTKPKAPPKEVETYTFDRTAAVTSQSWAKFEDLRGMDAMDKYASTAKIKELYKLLGPARPDLPQQAADWSMSDLLAAIKDSLVKSDYAKYTWTKRQKSLLGRRLMQMIKADPSTLFAPEECYHPPGSPDRFTGFTLHLTWGPKMYAAIHKAFGSWFYYYGSVTGKITFGTDTVKEIPGRTPRLPPSIPGASTHILRPSLPRLQPSTSHHISGPPKPVQVRNSTPSLRATCPIRRPKTMPHRGPRLPGRPRPLTCSTLLLGKWNQKGLWQSWMLPGRYCWLP
jgi:hypothetical protein